MGERGKKKVLVKDARFNALACEKSESSILILVSCSEYQTFRFEIEYTKYFRNGRKVSNQPNKSEILTVGTFKVIKM